MCKDVPHDHEKKEPSLGLKTAAYAFFAVIFVRLADRLAQFCADWPNFATCSIVAGLVLIAVTAHFGKPRAMIASWYVGGALIVAGLIHSS